MSQSAVLDRPEVEQQSTAVEPLCLTCEGTAARPRVVYGANKREICTNPFHQANAPDEDQR